MSGVTPSNGSSFDYQNTEIKPKNKKAKSTENEKIDSVKSEVLRKTSLTTNREIEKNQSFASSIDISQRVNKSREAIYPKEEETINDEEDFDEVFEIETSPIANDNFESPTEISITKDFKEQSSDFKSEEKEPEKEKENFKEVKDQQSSELTEWSQRNLSEENNLKDIESNQFSSIDDLETLRDLVKGKILNSLLIYEGNAFRETTILAEANVVVLREKETDKFNVIINHNCNREEVQTAFQEQAQNFGVNPQKVTYYQVANGEMWSHFQAELNLRFPQLAPQQTSSKDDSSSITQEEIRNQGRKEGPQKTKTKQKIPKEITQQATLAALKNSVRKSLSSYKEFSDQKAEEKRRVENDVLKWTLRAYDRAKEDLSKELKKGEVNTERLKKRAPLWADSLPPFPIIVRTNPQLYRGELKAKTLEQIAVLLERQNREGMR